MFTPEQLTDFTNICKDRGFTLTILTDVLGKKDVDVIDDSYKTLGLIKDLKTGYHYLHYNYVTAEGPGHHRVAIPTTTTVTAFDNLIQVISTTICRCCFDIMCATGESCLSIVCRTCSCHCCANCSEERYFKMMKKGSKIWTCPGCNGFHKFEF